MTRPAPTPNASEGHHPNCSYDADVTAKVCTCKFYPTPTPDAVEREWTGDYAQGYEDGHKVGEAFGHAAGADAERERLGPLLKAAVCPNRDRGCDGKGIPVQIGDDDWEQEQCQWCHERTLACGLDEAREGE